MPSFAPVMLMMPCGFMLKGMPLYCRICGAQGEAGSGSAGGSEARVTRDGERRKRTTCLVIPPGFLEGGQAWPSPLAGHETHRPAAPGDSFQRAMQPCASHQGAGPCPPPAHPLREVALGGAGDQALLKDQRVVRAHVCVPVAQHAVRHVLARHCTRGQGRAVWRVEWLPMVGGRSAGVLPHGLQVCTCWQRTLP